MDDVEFVFHETNRERKVNGYGDKHKVRGGGRIVRLGHDHMTAAQLKKMNGECKVYNMNRPVKYNVFKFWPDDLKKEYLSGLIERYDVTKKDIAEMLEVSPATVWRAIKALGISSSHDGYHVQSFEKEKSWREFLNSTSEKSETNTTEKNEPVIQKEIDTPIKSVIYPSDFWAISSSISYISGLVFNMDDDIRGEIIRHLQIIENSVKPYSPLEGF